MQQLTTRQKEIYEFIVRHHGEHGYMPSQAEIGQAFGFNHRAAAEHLRLIARKGFIQLPTGTERTARAIRLVKRQEDNALPLLGRVAAGSPVLADDAIEEMIPIPSALFHPRPTHLRRVSGDSMIEAGIFDRDLVAIRADDYQIGSIVVAKLAGPAGYEITLKRLLLEEGAYVLQPYNRNLSPKRVPSDARDEQDQREQTLEIEGTYCGHIRLRGD